MFVTSLYSYFDFDLTDFFIIDCIFSNRASPTPYLILSSMAYKFSFKRSTI